MLRERMDIRDTTETYRIILRCAIPSSAGATKARKSDGVIHEGTASTPTMYPSVSAFSNTMQLASGADDPSFVSTSFCRSTSR
jgi:hypothetical protein